MDELGTKRKEIRKLRNEKRLSKLEDKKRKEVRTRQVKEDLCVKKYMVTFGKVTLNWE